ncbi:MAG: DUF2344 domain-containing protein [Acidimicrobiaceae bacterium]|nr:TIGR03936 family radical SAM-associated protein [Ilumatobacter sp.]MCB9379769.1 DUF2344 domain-containing protein [Acidimicrobiaceae bacterium]MCO5329084.1 TIGR03936 family radical SAM-associated protein [Ilumatobacteraceae bacterium]
MKLRIRHTKLGKVRFTSHRDTARHWERAVRKAEVRLAYSAGFTPRPKLSFGLALPTGAESLAEYLDMELAPAEDPGDLAEFASRLGTALPVGYDVVRVAERGAGTSLQDAVVACTWQITLAGVDHAAADAAVARFLAASEVLLERERKGQRATDDVRPAVAALALLDAAHDPEGRPCLQAELLTSGRSLRPVELVSALLPEVDALDCAARVLRTHQWIDDDGARRELLPVDVVLHPGTGSA